MPCARRAWWLAIGVWLSAAWACDSLRSGGGVDGGAPDGGSPPDGATSPDAGADGGFDAGSPDAGPCDGSICPAELVAKDRILPIALAVNASHVYWLEYGPQHQGLEGSVNRIAKGQSCPAYDGGCVEDLTPGWGRFRVESIALTPEDACWLESYEDARDLICQSLTTGNRRKVATSQVWATGLRFDGERLVWVNRGRGAAALDGQLMQQNPSSTSPAEVLVSARPDPTSVAVDETRLFWTENGLPDAGGAVYSALRDGGQPLALAEGEAVPLGAAELGPHLYWASYREGTIRRAPKSGLAAAETLVADQRGPFALVVDSTGLYWLNLGTGPNYLDGQLVRADLDGGRVRVMVDRVPAASALAQDGEYVYFCAQGTYAANYLDGAVWRVLKRF